MNRFWLMACEQNEVCNTQIIGLYGKICPCHSLSLFYWLICRHGDRNWSSHVLHHTESIKNPEPSMTSKGDLPHQLSYLAHLTRKIHPLSCIHDPTYIILPCLSAGSTVNWSHNNINQVQVTFLTNPKTWARFCGLTSISSRTFPFRLLSALPSPRFIEL